MSKRFTATEKWADPWFRKLPPEYKLFWSYICDNCNNAGIWNVDLELAEFQIGVKLDRQIIEEIFTERIKPITGNYWYLPAFVSFQYGRLSEASKPHQQVASLLAKHSLWRGYPEGIHTLKDKDIDKDKAKAKETLGVVGDFEMIWQRYPNKDGKRDAERHFKTSVKTPKDWEDIQNALTNYLRSDKVKDGFIKNGSTWFNNWQDWIEYTGVKNGAHVGKSIFVQAAELRAKENAPPDRKELSAGEVLTRVRNLQPVSTENRTPRRAGSEGHGPTLEGLRENDSVEATRDRER